MNHVKALRKAIRGGKASKIKVATKALFAEQGKYENVGDLLERSFAWLSAREAVRNSQKAFEKDQVKLCSHFESATRALFDATKASKAKPVVVALVDALLPKVVSSSI